MSTKVDMEPVWKGNGRLTIQLAPAWQGLFSSIGERMNHESWEFFKNIIDVVGTFFLPLIAWVFYTVFQHSKKLATLEQKVNDQINMRLDNLETKFDSLDEKMDIVKDNVMDNKLHFQENMNTCMNTILLEIKKEK